MSLLKEWRLQLNSFWLGKLVLTSRAFRNSASLQKHISVLLLFFILASDLSHFSRCRISGGPRLEFRRVFLPR